RQAAVHAEVRVLQLNRGSVRGGLAIRLVAAATVVEVHRGGHQAGREEVRREALEGGGEVERRVGVADLEQDDRLADLRALAPHVHGEVRGGERAEVAAEDVDAAVAARWGGRAGR